jgi:hypothetical protein
MRHVFGRFFRPLLQFLVYRKGHLRHFVNRRRYCRCLRESVPRAERLQLVSVDGVGYLVEQFAQLRIAVRVVAAFEHPVHRIVKIAPRGGQMSRLVIRFSRRELFLHPHDQVFNSARQRLLQVDQRLRRQVPQWQRFDWQSRGLLGRWRGLQCRHLRLHRPFRRVVAAHQP